MKQFKLNQAFVLMFTLVNLSFGLFSFNAAKFGLDSYSIYLNDKLIVKHYVNQPLNLRVLPLNTAKGTDLVRISYNHCTIKNGAGTGRGITLQDEKGTVIKKWVFADASGADLNMEIPVKDLQKLAKTHVGQELSLHYTARELPKGEMLSLLQL